MKLKSANLRRFAALSLVWLVTANAQSSSSHEPLAGSSPQPSLEMAKLIKVFSGTWSITLDGGQGRGEERWRPGPGGLSLVEEYRSDGREGTITGIGFFWWDNAAGRFRVVWCDSTDSKGCVVMKYGARWERGELVLEHGSDAPGEAFHFREVFSDIDTKSFKQTLFQGRSSNALRRLVTITAIRK